MIKFLSVFLIQPCFSFHPLLNLDVSTRQECLDLLLLLDLLLRESSPRLTSPPPQLGGSEEPETGDDHEQHQPDHEHPKLGVAEQLAAKLDGEDELTGGDHDEDPALSPETLALGVRDVSVELAGGGRRHEADGQDPHDADGVLGWEREDVLHEESIQLNHLAKLNYNVTILQDMYDFQPAICT